MTLTCWKYVIIIVELITLSGELDGHALQPCKWLNIVRMEFYQYVQLDYVISRRLIATDYNTYSTIFVFIGVHIRCM